ncbi:MAG TPA: polymer-forming cytoskeletal protein [Candidatus Polarisedimenticolaceae bacterium]|nr:polymer-forming cytoskeletal protein [Candidatus Polarisedimenticolaceae bacterium]
MRDPMLRKLRAGIGLLVAAFALGAALRAADPPDPPDMPEPPEPPSPVEGKPFKGVTIRQGETHKGDIYQFAPSVDVEGTQDGDLFVWAPAVRIPGTVTGDVFVAGSSVQITGTVQKSVRTVGGSIFVDGTIDGNLQVYGGEVRLGSKAHIKGNVRAGTGQLISYGVIDGDLDFTGGTVLLGGKILEDASVTADKIEIQPGARIEGDLDYSTRERMDDELKKVVGGEVDYNEKPILAKEEKEEKRSGWHPTPFGFGVRIAFFTASFLFGCALLALFRNQEPKVTEAIRVDTLRCLGIGFVSILVTFAVIVSAILIITLIFIPIYLIAYLIVAYLAKIPVAIWLGRLILEKLNKQPNPFAALFLGLVALYLVFALPWIGILAYLGAMLLGMGAMITTYIAYRQTRKAADAMATAPATPPAEAIS